MVRNRGYNNGGRGNGGGRGNRNRNRNTNQKKKKDKTSKSNKTLKDHHYYVGSAKSATDYVTVTNYILNYIRRTYKKGGDVADALETFKEIDFSNVKPTMAVVPLKKPDGTTDYSQEERESLLKQAEREFDVDYKLYKERITQYEDNKSQAAALLYEQCSSTMQTKLQGRENFLTDIKTNPIKLLSAIKEHALSYESTKYTQKTICDAMKSFVNIKQREDESNIDYLKRFKVARDVFKSHAGDNFTFTRAIEDRQEFKDAFAVFMDGKKSDTERHEAYTKMRAISKESFEIFEAYLFVDNCDHARYSQFLSGLETQYGLEHDQYPKTLALAYKAIDNVKVKRTNKESSNYRPKKSHSNNSSSDQKKDEDSKELNLSFAQIKNSCYCCGKNHKLPDCPDRHKIAKDEWHINKTKEAKQYQSFVNEIKSTMVEDLSRADAIRASANSSVNTSSTDDAASTIESIWNFYCMALTDPTTSKDLTDLIVMDSGSSSDLFCKLEWLLKVEQSMTPASLETNAGKITVDKEGTLPDYGKVMYSPKAMTNILSLAMASDKYRITMDTAIDNAFLVHTPQGIRRFARDANNLYTYQPAPQVKQTHVQTLEENLKFHTPREISRAKAAKRLIEALGSPSVRDLKSLILMNAIANCPINTKDIDIAEKIFGPDLGTLKGKTTRKKALPLVTDQIELPRALYSQLDNIRLCMDVMFVNELPFLTTISKRLYYRTALFLPTRTSRDLFAILDRTLRVYNDNGFTISHIECDNEFRKIFEEVEDDLDVNMVFVSPRTHQPDAERNNRVLKERMRATYHRLPYAALPKAIVKVMVKTLARKTNFFPAKNGISKYFSPRQIVHKETLDYKRHCLYSIGQYVQAHEDRNPKHGQEPRTLDCIYLEPTTQGHDVYDIHTQRVINRAHVTPMPVTPTIIQAVEAIAEAEGQKGLRIKTRRGGTLYDSSWTAGVEFDEDEDESDYEYDSDDDDDTTTTEDFSYDSDSDSEDEQEAQEILNDQEERQTTGVQPKEEDSVQDDVSTDDEEEDNPPPLVRRSARTRTQRQVMQPSMTGQTYSHSTPQMHLMVPENEASEYGTDAAQYAANLLHMLRYKHSVQKKAHQFLITYSLQKGIKKFGTKGYQSALNEMKQLHDRDCWTPIKLQSLSKSERKKALESLIFLVEKKSGKIKARHCANGSKQRQWMDSDEAASPTVMTHSVLLTATIEAEEGRDVATFDIPNAFIQTHVNERDDQGDRIIMKIRGAMIDMLLEIDNDQYAPCVTTENGQRVLYVHIQRAIYGMLMSGLLFYKKFRASVEKIGYKVNPYDPCVANKMINGKQHTISWHVDDVKSSHVDPKVNDDFHKWLQKEYGQVKEVTCTRDKIHDYLGMKLDYSTPGEVKIDMRDYVKAMIEEFPKQLKGDASTPASDKLFNTEGGKKLDELKAEAFHTFVAKALFLTMRARPDIRLAVAFLCTRVKEPTTYDWVKLTRMMDYLKRTQEECLTLRSDGSRSNIWSVDAAYAVHPDAKSHSGMTMTMGKGAIISMSRKQKLVTRSSTEAELVAVDDSMTDILWTKHFLEEQGYQIKSRIVLQDNESSIRLEKNGYKSVGQRSRHIKNRYFFITDQVQQGNIQIEYCPTDDIDGDYMSKALQGRKFGKHKVKIMNLPTPVNTGSSASSKR